MSAIEEVAGVLAEKLLADAAERNFAVAIDLKDGQQWLRYPSRFLELHRGRPMVLRLELPTEPAMGRPVRLATGQKVIVNFNANSQRYRFAAAVIQTGWFKLAGGTQVEGIVATFPMTVQRLQRRSSYRHHVPLTQVVVVTIWPGGQQARDMAMAGGEPVSLGRLVNISVGGLCIRLYGRTHLGLELNSLLGLEFELDGGAQLRLTGQVRRRTLGPDGSTELGVQFAESDKTMEARQAEALLTRRLNELQQQELRRVRAI